MPQGCNFKTFPSIAYVMPMLKRSETYSTYLNTCGGSSTRMSPLPFKAVRSDGSDAASPLSDERESMRPPSSVGTAGAHRGGRLIEPTALCAAANLAASAASREDERVRSHNLGAYG